MKVIEPICVCGDYMMEHIDGEEQCCIPECGCKAYESRPQDTREFSPEQEAIIERMTAEAENQP